MTGAAWSGRPAAITAGAAGSGRPAALMTGDAERAATQVRARRAEDGAGVVVSTAVLGVLVVAAVAASGAVGVVAAHRTAQAAADLAALAGASALQDGRDACGRAGTIARRNGATLRRCEVQGWEVAVVVGVDTVRLPGGALDLAARARAGPVLSAPGP